MKPRRFREEGYNIGQYVQLYKRVKRQIDKRSEAGHEVRVNVGNKVVEVTPDWDNKNIDPGTATGAIISAVASYVSEYVPMSADTEIVDYEDVEGGTRYTVNVDAPIQQQARFQAMMESGHGFTSLITDEFDVGEPEVSNKRMARDTWQYEVVVKDADTSEQVDSIGLGFLN